MLSWMISESYWNKERYTCCTELCFSFRTREHVEYYKTETCHWYQVHISKHRLFLIILHNFSGCLIPFKKTVWFVMVGKQIPHSALKVFLLIFFFLITTDCSKIISAALRCFGSSWSLKQKVWFLHCLDILSGHFLTNWTIQKYLTSPL